MFTAGRPPIIPRVSYPTTYRHRATILALPKFSAGVSQGPLVNPPNRTCLRYKWEPEPDRSIVATLLYGIARTLGDVQHLIGKTSDPLRQAKLVVQRFIYIWHSTATKAGDGTSWLQISSHGTLLADTCRSSRIRRYIVRLVNKRRIRLPHHGTYHSSLRQTNVA